MLLLAVGLLFFVTGCSQGPQNGAGGSVAGPTVTVNCQKVTAAGGGNQGDTIVTTNCPKDSGNDNSTEGKLQ